MLLNLAFLVNVLIVVCELIAILNIKKKRDIFKYYTYLHNLLGLLASATFVVFFAISKLYGVDIPEFVRGIRYVATSGLVATFLIYFLLLRKDNVITDDDMLRGCNAKNANIIFHYLCPFLTLVSFVLLERNVLLEDGIWTMLVNIPSISYWVIYIFLSITKLWEEPYKFSNKNKILDALTYILMPVIFIAVTILLWIIR